MIIVYVIIAGLASFFFASSSSFWCFLLSLQGDSCASVTTPAQWVHICGTKHVCLSGGGKTRLSHCYKMSNPCVNYGIPKKILVGGFNPCQKIHVPNHQPEKSLTDSIARDGAKDQSSPLRRKVSGASLHGFSLRWMACLLPFSHRVCLTTRTPRSIRLGHYRSAKCHCVSCIIIYNMLQYVIIMIHLKMAVHRFTTVYLVFLGLIK